MTTQLQLEMNQRADIEARLRRLIESNALDELDRELLRLLWRFQGRAHPAPLGYVARELKLPFATRQEQERSAREIKARVKELIEFHGVKIGSSRRVGQHGYFLIVDAEDHRLAVQPLQGEFFSLCRRIAALNGKQFLAELYGQFRAELDQAAAPKRGAA